jgi:hypothetical protein
VTVADKGGIMGGPYGPGAMMGGGWQGMSMARVFASPGVVAARMVSLRVVNQGPAHELVVPPLPAGQAAGEPDGRHRRPGR